MADKPRISKLWFLRLLQQTLDRGQEMDWHVAKMRSVLFRYLPTLNRNLGEKSADFDAIHGLVEAEMEKTARCVLPLEGSYPHLCGVVAKQYGLSPAECSLLAFVVLASTDPDWLSLSEHISVRRRDGVLSLLSQVVEVDAHTLKLALRPQSPLIEGGLLTCEVSDTPFEMPIPAWLRPIDGLDEQALIDPACWQKFVEGHVRPAPVAELSITDFPHLEDDATLVLDVLRAAKGQGRSVQVLLHGSAGVGKSSLAHALAQAAGLKLYEVSNSDVKGHYRDGTQRLNGYRLAQRLLDPSKNALLYDDVDDLFAGHHFEGAHPSTLRGWINGSLESSHVSCIFTANRIDQIIMPHLRRFDLIVEAPTPPSHVHKKMLAKALGDAEGECDGWLERMVNQKLTPALVSQATRIAHLVTKRRDKFMDVFERVLKTNMRGQGKSLRTKRESVALPYDISFLNTDIPVESVMEGLSRSGEGRLLLVGPPGTGKTALAKHVAERLGKPLHHRRSSDILNMYVGATEKKIALLFHDAEEEGAVLFLDEVDSLLYDRDEMAVRSWEVSQTNELLSRMEEFRGIMLSATNRFDALDPAVKRRFDIKVEFGYLTTPQAMKMLLALLGAVQISCDPYDLDEYRLRLARLGNLALGDFAALHRRFQLLDVTTNSAETVVTQLERLSQEKPGQSRQIGFVLDAKTDHALKLEERA